MKLAHVVSTIDSSCFMGSFLTFAFKEKKREMVIVLLRHFKQTQDFTSFPRQAIIAHQGKLNSYFRALQYRSLLGANTF